MELPAELLGQSVEAGEIYFFEDDKLPGVPGHMHACVCHKGTVLIFGTCSSQKNTAIRLAEYRHDDPRTYPLFEPTDTNKFKKETYIDCNQVFAVSEEDFGSWRLSNKVQIKRGKMDAAEIQRLIDGILLSDRVAGEIQDLFKD